MIIKVFTPKGQKLTFDIVDGKEITLGYYGTEEEAANAYEQAAKNHFKSFARVS